MSPEIIQLEDYYLNRIHLDFHPPTGGGTVSETLSLDFDYDAFQHDEDALLRMLSLHVRGRYHDKNKTKLGPEFDVEIRGVFRVPASMEPGHQDTLLRVNGVSILYSTLRGILGNLTGSFPGGRICLPTISPPKIVENVEARKQAKVLPSAKSTKSAQKKSARKAVRKKTAKPTK